MPQDIAPTPATPSQSLGRAVAAWADWYVRMGVLDSVEMSGIDRYRSAAPAMPAPAPGRAEAVPPARRPAAPEGEQVQHARAVAAACATIEELEAALEAFDGCPLKRTATRLCFADGNPRARVLLIGEAPGAEEDARGEPFVGQAGRLLDNMLTALGLARGRNVYIANVLKCRPPNNRTPEAAEAAACRPYLERQVALLRPKLIVALGKSAASLLLATDATIASLRGRVHRYRGVPLVVTYHPAYLLRNLPDKAKAWEDLLLARRTVAQATQLDPAKPPSAP